MQGVVDAARIAENLKLMSATSILYKATKRTVSRFSAAPLFDLRLIQSSPFSFGPPTILEHLNIHIGTLTAGIRAKSEVVGPFFKQNATLCQI